MGPNLTRYYQKGLREHLPKAEIVFDRFHVMQLAGKAVDEVRKQLHREGVTLKGGALGAARQCQPPEPRATPTTP